ncbi:hypothetical protein RHOSPDRAFT_31487 [Rhodotorula sp. JG-1b]|nr:hypothetical protein RHOSPDRAFT_31487 [Rhodotorula sp. JG-1b]
MMMMATSPTSPAAAFASPLGPAHFAAPENQGTALKAVLKLFRRSKPSPASVQREEEESPVAAAPMGWTAFPASTAAHRAGLQCQMERSTSFTVAYEPRPLPAIFEAADAAERRLSAPPAYDCTAVEEDIVITESGDVFIKATAVPGGEVEQHLPIKVETPSERKIRQKQDRLEQKRRELLEQDQFISEALAKMGL